METSSYQTYNFEKGGISGVGIKIIESDNLPPGSRIFRLTCAFVVKSCAVSCYEEPLAIDKGFNSSSICYFCFRLNMSKD